MHSGATRGSSQRRPFGGKHEPAKFVAYDYVQRPFGDGECRRLPARKVMITSCRIIGGYAAKLNALKDRTFTFSSGLGLTVLFGPNGCGKSTLLRALGTGSGIPSFRDEAGWSRYVEPSRCTRVVDGSEQRIPYPERFSYISEYASFKHAWVPAEVVWDGTATLLHDTELADTRYSIHGFDAPNDGTVEADKTFDETVRRATSNNSSGMERAHKISNIIRHASKPPDLTQRNPYMREYVSEVWQLAQKEFADYVRTLPRTGPPTLLLDEPDRSLSLPMQAALWQVLLSPSIKVQCIVATHCPFALVATNIIDLVPGYVDECRTLLTAASWKTA